MRQRTPEIRRFWVGGPPDGKANGQGNGKVNGRANGVVDGLALESAIRNCQEYLLDTQYREGYWWGELESNATITAEYLMLTHFLGIGEKRRWAQVSRYLLSCQREDGTWAVYYGGPGDLNITVEAYFALKLAGISADDPRMVKAKQFILSEGGLPKVRNFTRKSGLPCSGSGVGTPSRLCPRKCSSCQRGSPSTSTSFHPGPGVR